ncbi:MAG: lytic transglycosylase domain-containing protein [Candidatus Eremiobacteraeota bacterium]|nr:lytic transglycosylase domain-containing protein [Candidatus Eremiobacteraeota bacterium]
MNTTGGEVTIRNKYYPFVLHRVYCHNPHYPWKDIKKIGKSIIYYSRKYDIDPLLLTALINIESAFDVDAVSVSGAIGLGQLMPGTARSLGVDPENVVQNVGGAAKYLNYQLRRWRGYKNTIPLALASYNAGPGAVQRYGGIPPYSETRNYVFFITFLRDRYNEQFEEKLPERKKSYFR